ncbi:M48 family metallopeptidase [Candidatus Woesearchaeota archaeon]|nr:M48 family metallopeptidase [Candidatus Woesearchaeota archaeon]
MMNLAELAFYELYPGRKNDRVMSVKYSRAFRSYNANVKYTSSRMDFRLSYEWKSVSDEMKIGLIQSLMVKVFRDKEMKAKRTINMDLYDNFIKGVGEYRPATEQDPVLRESFDRVNEKYFSGFMEDTNLVWGASSFSKLGTFTYADNTITISRVLEDDEELLDYVVYHEMLHKKHKFYTNKAGQSRHHTAAFKRDERRFENPDIERKLESYLRKKRWTAYTDVKEKQRKQKIKKLFEWFFG